MNFLKRMAAVGLSGLAIISIGGGVADAAPKARAAESCSSFGVNGLNFVCVLWDSQDYRATLYTGSEDRGLMDFNLICANGRWFGDLGAFDTGPWNDYSYVFPVGSQLA
ncbi:hypothetical protein JK364_53740 [Streptomyces sp. 110]|uniref:Uncharacterized protein n=1 Tax=Streptomyces endocoffeicus TaxID=2898945 RepID=A0ABS1QAP9_9ACTN|nr:hypothetical protein [Streptomyces endocoffeicus]MBL1121031.1 hypothetical protein [Streptomyces endocoffeicus]